jgi:hypothetical protein
MSDLQHIAIAAALAWASGIRLYAVVFLVGILGWSGWLALPPGLAVLAHPWVLVASGALAVAEFAADKIPGFDSLWDGIHTFIRIPAGAVLAGAALLEPTADNAALAVVAGLLGGTITAGSHFTKAGARVAINHSPEPFSNWLASFFEDLFAPGLVWLGIVAPFLLLGALLLAVLAAAWLLPRLWRGVTAPVRWLLGSGRRPPADPSVIDP